MFCMTCGKQLEAVDVFCSGCGTKVMTVAESIAEEPVVKQKKYWKAIILLGVLAVLALVAWVTYSKYFGRGSHETVLKRYAKCYENLDIDGLVALYPEELRPQVSQHHIDSWTWRYYPTGYCELLSVELVDIVHMASYEKYDWLSEMYDEPRERKARQATELYIGYFDITKKDISSGEITTHEEWVVVGKIDGEWYLLEY